MTFIVDGKPVEGVTSIKLDETTKVIKQEPIKITIDGDAAIKAPSDFAPAKKEGTFEKFFNSCINWAKENPLQVMLFVAGLFVIRKVVKNG